MGNFGSFIKDKATAGFDKTTGNILDKLPKELAPYRPAVKCALKGDMLEAVLEVCKKLLPMIGIALGVIIVAFVIKWWLGLIAIPVMLGWLCWKIFKIVYGITKFIKTMPLNAASSLLDLI